MIITNQDKLTKELISTILPTSENLFFLVGYFYFSGWELLFNEITNKNLKILVGLEIEKNILGRLQEVFQYEEFTKSHKDIRNNYYDKLVQAINASDKFDDAEDSFKTFVTMIKSGRLEIRKTAHPNHAKLYIFEEKEENNHGGDRPGTIITGSSNLTASGMKFQHELNVYSSTKEDYLVSKDLFDELWETATVIVDKDYIEEFEDKVLSKVWIDNLPSPYLMYVRVLKEYFDLGEEEEVISPKKITRSKFINLKYQVDAIAYGIKTIKKHNGIIISDVVGLGKSIIASAVAHNLKIPAIIISPPHLKEQWDDYSNVFKFSAKIVSSGKIEDALDYLLEDDEQLIIIDEAHKYRNEKTNDYGLLHQVCQGNKVMLLTATPFNNRPEDIFSLIKLFQIPAKSTIQTVSNLGIEFSDMIVRYKKVEKQNREQKITASQLDKEITDISKKIRDILNPLMIRRTRIDLLSIPKYKSDLEKQNIEFSNVLPPDLLEYELGKIEDLYIETLAKIDPADNKGYKGARYKPVSYLKDYKKYHAKLTKTFGNAQQIRIAQTNMAKFMKRNLVRRFESSIYAFSQSIDNFIASNKLILDWIEEINYIPVYKKSNLPEIKTLLGQDGFISEELKMQRFREKIRPYEEDGLSLIEAEDVSVEFVKDINRDTKLLETIKKKWFADGIKYDPKLEHFKNIIRKSLLEDEKRKIVVFSQYTDTINYLYDQMKVDFRVFKYSGQESSSTNKDIVNANFNASSNFQADDFDILLATDAISEGYNLHRAGTIFNYDIPYNPTTVIQRVGRINRIDKKVFENLYIYNYFPTFVGAKLNRVKDITNLKFAFINALIGEDTNVITPDHDLKSYYKEIYENEISKDQEQSWDTPYKKFLGLLSDKTINQALAIPFRARIMRKDSYCKEGAIMYGKKDYDSVFKYRFNTGEVIALTAKEAFDIFYAEPSAKAFNTSKDFSKDFNRLKNILFKQDTLPRHDKGVIDTVKQIKQLMKDFSNENDYLEDLLKVVQDLNALPGYYAKQIRAIGNDNLEDDFNQLLIDIPHNYLIRIIKRAEKVSSGQETIILSQELKGDQND